MVCKPWAVISCTSSEGPLKENRGFRVKGLGVKGLGVKALGLKVKGLGFRGQGVLGFSLV